MNKKESPQKETPDTLTNKMVQWRRANPQATLTEIEEAVEAELAQLRQALVTKMTQEEMLDTQAEMVCPDCGQKMVKNGQRKRKLRSKEGQTIELNRQQWRCLDCGTTLFPPG